jgi:hypothetical protein
MALHCGYWIAADNGCLVSPVRGKKAHRDLGSTRLPMAIPKVAIKTPHPIAADANYAITYYYLL